MSKHWSGLPFLDALRPEPGWIVDRAVLATYSADLVAVAAALLALAGLDDDRGSGSKVDFANAYEQLRDRVRVLVQAGRLALPARKTPILSIFDRFIREVNVDESNGSWHPKAALIRLQSQDNEEEREWRLWIGSRNLTRSLDWDAGLVLIGRLDGSDQPIPGVADLGTELARLAKLPDFSPQLVQQELTSVRWQGPKGVVVDELRLLAPGSQRGLPAQPSGIKKLVVVSPFIDGTTVKRLGRWGDKKTEKVLLSTQPELARLNAQAGRPLARFQQLLSLDMPEQEGQDVPPEETTEEQELTSEDEEIEARGLHAKLIYTERVEGGGMLWLGSANATHRAWDGPNFEVVAQLGIDQTVAEGIEVFLNEVASTIDVATLPMAAEIEPEEKWLEEARKQVAARWQVTQQRHPRGPLLTCDQPPHPDRGDVKLEVGLLACDLVPWLRRQKQLQLPQISQSRETELIQIRLSLGSHQCAWLQRAPLEPPPDEERDRRALARYLDPRTFLLWIRALLSAEDIGDGGGEWDTEPTPARRSGPTAAGPIWWAPTLEEVLRAWSRDPDRLQIIDRKVEYYLKLMQEQPDIERSEEETRILQEFQETWDVIRQILVSEMA